jgi:hypothetical protein
MNLPNKGKLKRNIKILCLTLLGVIIGVSYSVAYAQYQELCPGKLTIINSGTRNFEDAKPEFSKAVVPHEVGAGVDELEGREKYQAIIKAVAQEKGFEDTDALLRLAHCESRFDASAKHVNKDGSEDLGLFQINKYWHVDRGKSITVDEAFNPYVATEWTINKIKAGGVDMWACQWAYHDTGYDYLKS